ncbi:MAG: hypothetical protein ACR2P0_15585 [Acidimicrobiales bacterium]
MDDGTDDEAEEVSGASLIAAVAGGASTSESAVPTDRFEEHAATIRAATVIERAAIGLMPVRRPALPKGSTRDDTGSDPILEKGSEHLREDGV